MHALTAWDAMEKCTTFTHQRHPLSPSLKAHSPGSSCPLPSTPTRGAPSLSGAALPLLPDPPSPPPAPSRCLLPVLAISLFCGGCVDTLQKPPTAPTPPQAVSPRSHDHQTSSSRSHDHRLLIAMASLAGGMLGRCDIDEETSGSAPASRSQKVPMFQHMFMRSQRGGDISILKIEGPQDRDDEGTTVSTLYSSTYVHEFIFETRRKPLSTDG